MDNQPFDPALAPPKCGGEELALRSMQLRETSPTLLDEQEDGSLACPSCRNGRLRLVSETPHPLYGVLGVIEYTFPM